MENLWNKCRPVLAVFLALFFIEVLLGIHGFSLPVWGEFIGEARNIQVISGNPQAVRSDDWRVALPVILSQRMLDPAFPKVSPLVGDPSTRMFLVPSAVPIAHPLVLFRPAAWGYFVGGDTGLAWNWGFSLFGLLAAVFMTTMLFTGDRWISLFTALGVTYSPFFQFWSLTGAITAIFALLIMIASTLLFLSRRPLHTVMYGLLLAWSLGCFFMTMYPPYQVSLGYLALAGFGALLWQHRRDIRPGLGLKLAVAGGAFVFFLGVVFAFLHEVRQELPLLLGTVYPGQRLSVGGLSSWVRLFNSHLWAFRRSDGVNLYGNICEGASFFLFFPLAVGAFAIQGVRRRQWPDASALVLGAFVLFLFAWALVPFGETFASITLMGRVPESRSIIALGIANHLLLAVMVASGVTSLQRGFKAGLAVAFAAGLGAVAYQLHGLAPGIPLPLMSGAWAVSGLLGYLLLRRPRAGLAAVAGLGFLATVSFNPVVRGGADFASRTQLGQAVIAADRAAGGGRWLVFGDSYVPDFLKMLGVKSINGTHVYPMFDFWRAIDPEGRDRDIYNRYAHVEFGTTGEPASPPRIKLVVFDDVRVELHPDSDALERLKVDFVLAGGVDAERFLASSRYEKVATVGARSIFRRR